MHTGKARYFCFWSTFTSKKTNPWWKVRFSNIQPVDFMQKALPVLHNALPSFRNANHLELTETFHWPAMKYVVIPEMLMMQQK